MQATASITCGKCKATHHSVQEVKDCYALGTPVSAAQVAQAKAPASAAVPATDKQVAFLQTLIGERPEWADTNMGWKSENLSEMSKLEASEWITALLAQPKEGGAGNGTNDTPVAGDTGNVPQGYYAVASATGNNDLDFYRVDRPTEGKWAGRVFVKRVIGGHGDTPVRGKERGEALARIEAAGAQEAALLYGQEIGRCCRCNRSLTDETSRAYGKGPDCRAQDGW